MTKAIYRLVSTSRERVVESPFFMRGERVAAFCLEEAAIRVARVIRESEWKTVYGCYDQPDGTFLIGLASARAGGKLRQKISLKAVPGNLDPSAEVWKSVTAGRVSGPLNDFVRRCLQPFVGQ